ncbi:hypothetical protein Adt_23335 [Abeliophyllum distichum]|uniref:Transposase n=1 Tax=Abeliophyllum distichum TaxID=126358 RepID=A0ABD1SAJ6_9LAMI
MHPFFREVLKDWNLAQCQITPNGWGQMVASYLLWIVAEAGEIWLRGSLSPYTDPAGLRAGIMFLLGQGRSGELATDSPNKVHNWKERFFFVGGDWEIILEDPLPHVSIPRDSGNLSPISKRNQGELRSKWDKVRALSSEFRSLNNLLKDDNLLASCGLMGSKEYPCFVSPVPPAGRVLRHKPLGKRRRVDANVPSRPPSSSNLHIDSTTSRDKGKKVVEGVEEVPSQKRKAPAATEGLMRDARKARRTEEGRHSLPSLDGEPEGASNSVSSAGQNHHIRISERREELAACFGDGMLPAHLSIVAASVHRYWTSSWEKVAEEKKVAEASQKRTDEAQKLAEDRTLVTETALAAANSSLKAAAADSERSLSAIRLESEKNQGGPGGRRGHGRGGVSGCLRGYARVPGPRAAPNDRGWRAASGANHGSPPGVGSFFSFARLPPKLMCLRLVQVMLLGETNALLVLTLEEAAGATVYISFFFRVIIQ